MTGASPRRALVAILAGGQGRRMGGHKALADFHGEPLIARPLRAAADAGLDAVVVAKAATALPALDVPVWLEPDEPVHPLLGIVTALERAERPVVAVGCDMPFVSADLLAREAAMRATLAALDPATFDVDERPVASINTPGELADA